MSPEIKFNVDTQLQFDRIFPPAQIQAYEEDGVEDWVNIFDVLTDFDFPQIKPEGKEAVIKLFNNHKLGSEIIKKQVNDDVFVYKRNITPLLNASLDVFNSAVDYFTDDYKKVLDYVLSPTAPPTRNAERDWQR